MTPIYASASVGNADYYDLQGPRSAAGQVCTDLFPRCTLLTFANVAFKLTISIDGLIILLVKE